MGKRKEDQRTDYDSSSSSSSISFDAKRNRPRDYQNGEKSRTNDGTPWEGFGDFLRDAVIELKDTIQVKLSTEGKFKRKIEKIKEKRKKDKKKHEEDLRILKQELAILKENVRILQEGHQDLKSKIGGMPKEGRAEVQRKGSPRAAPPSDARGERSRDAGGRPIEAVPAAAVAGLLGGGGGPLLPKVVGGPGFVRVGRLPRGGDSGREWKMSRRVRGEGAAARRRLRHTQRWWSWSARGSEAATVRGSMVRFAARMLVVAWRGGSPACEGLGSAPFLWWSSPMSVSRRWSSGGRQGHGRRRIWRSMSRSGHGCSWQFRLCRWWLVPASNGARLCERRMPGQRPRNEAAQARWCRHGGGVAASFAA
ncbi:uncharacterized protein [Lolium perenne]|uniref:uncharacterized protein isoform X2 n=1 Tax=Lolium perenne TaxID=4522 RepID=UPI003A99FB22